MDRRAVWVSLVLVLASVFAVSFPCFADGGGGGGGDRNTITITTYYPSPYGVYNELRAKRMAIGEDYYKTKDKSGNSVYGWGDGENWASKSVDLVVERNVMIGNPDATISVPSRGLGINTYPQYPIDIVGKTLTGDNAHMMMGWVWGPAAFFGAPYVGLCGGNTDFSKAFCLFKDLGSADDATYLLSTGRLLLQSTANGETDTVSLGANVAPSTIPGLNGMFIYHGTAFDSSKSWGAIVIGDSAAYLGLSTGTHSGVIFLDDSVDGSLRIRTYGNDVIFGNCSAAKCWESMHVKPGTGAGDADLHVYGDVHVDGTVYTGNIQKSDIAENFLTEKGAEPGDVMAVDVNNDERMVRSCRPYSPLVAGIISENPGLVIAGKKKKGYKPLALKGRVLCKVTDEGGKIRRGDLLVSSSKPGYAMKADPKKITLPTQIVGIAMQNLSPKKHEGKIMVFVK